MGNSKSDSKNNKQQGSQEIENYYDEVTQYDECCGIQRKKTIKRGPIWEDNFNRNCEDLHMYYEWAHDLQQVVKNYGRKLPRKKFLDQVNALRVIDQIQVPKQNQILLSPSQIDQFKVNLKNSVLLSYGQAKKSSRPKQISKIESVIFNSSTKQQKNLNLSSSFNNPPSIRKRSEFPYDQLRKDSILREREKTLRQSYSKSGLRQSIMSFVDDTMSNLFRGHQKQISKQSAHCLQVFLKFSLILEKHLCNKQNIICAVIQCFTNYIYKKYTIFQISEGNKVESELSEMSERQKQVLHLDEIEQKIKNKIKKERFKQLQRRKSLSTQQVEDLTTDIKIFLVLLRQIIQDYYKTNQFSHEFIAQGNQYREEDTQREFQENYNINTLITNQDNILILVTAILFKNEKFYNHIMSIFIKFHAERQKNFTNIIQGLKDRPPQYFQIKGEYCLNAVTLDKFKGKGDRSNNILDQLQKKSQTVNKSSFKSESGEDKNKSESQIKGNSALAKPYKKCAETLQKMLKSKTPSSKMKVIMECSQKITESVAEFYNAHQIQLKNHVLDADQILSIFCYILAANSLENIHANLFLIQHFATENQMISVTGYYYSVLTIAIEQLQNMYSSTVADIQTLNSSQLYSAKQSSVRSKKVKKSFGKSSIKDGVKEKSKKGVKNSE